MPARSSHASPSPSPSALASRPLNGNTFKFPPLHTHTDHHHHHHPVANAADDGCAIRNDDGDAAAAAATTLVSPTSTLHFQDAWQPRRAAIAAAAGKDGKKDTMLNGLMSNGFRRTRQKSLSEALKTIKDRRGSVSDNAHEVVEALKAPVSPKLVILCGVWYMTSIFSNASSKAILTAFRYPVTLTVVQFGFVCAWCLASAWLARRFPRLQALVPALRHAIRPPSRELVVATLPLTAFQIGGHIMNSDAMSRIPVSLVHTIKGLSPLLTVLAYRLVLRVRYSLPTYLSLVPLTLGVVMACSANVSGDALGLLGALGSTVLFVTQNIVSKKLFNEAARAELDAAGLPQSSRAAATAAAALRAKPDKLNLLCYSSGLALILTLPLWLWSEGATLLSSLVRDGGVAPLLSPPRPGSSRARAATPRIDHPRALALEFLFNGTFHFAQSLVAFVLLSMVSPVTYSVASLIKRVFVITFAVAWFGNPMTRVQAAGIALTFVGLYLYDRTNDAARADRRARALGARADPPVLPLVAADRKFDPPPPPPLQPPLSPAPPPMSQPLGVHGLAAATRRPSAEKGRANDSAAAALPLLPGTKQAETWKAQDAPQTNGLTA